MEDGELAREFPEPAFPFALRLNKAYTKGMKSKNPTTTENRMPKKNPNTPTVKQLIEALSRLPDQDKLIGVRLYGFGVIQDFEIEGEIAKAGRHYAIEIVATKGE